MLDNTKQAIYPSWSRSLSSAKAGLGIKSQRRCFSCEDCILWNMFHFYECHIHLPLRKWLKLRNSKKIYSSECTAVNDCHHSSLRFVLGHMRFMWSEANFYLSHKMILCASEVKYIRSGCKYFEKGYRSALYISDTWDFPFNWSSVMWDITVCEALRGAGTRKKRTWLSTYSSWSSVSSGRQHSIQPRGMLLGPLWAGQKRQRHSCQRLWTQKTTFALVSKIQLRSN